MSNEPHTYRTIAPCIVCKKELTSELPEQFKADSEFIQPHKGVSFSGYGAYGSRHDMSPEYVINVCDDCLQKAIDNDEVLSHKAHKVIEHSYVNAKDGEPGTQGQRRAFKAYI